MTEGTIEVFGSLLHWQDTCLTEHITRPGAGIQFLPISAPDPHDPGTNHHAVIKTMVFFHSSNET